MPLRRWEIHEANVQTMIRKMDGILYMLSNLVSEVKRLPNVTNEIVDLTNKINQATHDLHELMHAQ